MKLGLRLLQERAMVGSFWWPYISNLPEAYSVPIFFPGEDLKNLQYAPLLYQVFSHNHRWGYKCLVDLCETRGKEYYAAILVLVVPEFSLNSYWELSILWHYSKYWSCISAWGFLFKQTIKLCLCSCFMLECNQYGFGLCMLCWCRVCSCNEPILGHGLSYVKPFCFLSML